MTSPTAWRIDWTVVGPRSTDRQDFPDRGPNLDFVPPEAGAYTVTATRSATQPPPPPAGAPADNSTAAPPDPQQPLGGWARLSPAGAARCPSPSRRGRARTAR